MHHDDDLYMTEAERLALIAVDFDCEPQLALVIRHYYKGIFADRPHATKAPEPGCCFMAHEHDGDSVRTYACVADYHGLVAIYRLRSDGRFVRLTSWPRWIIELDRDPDRRAHCRRLEANSKRRQRRARVRLDRLVAKLQPPAPTPPAVRSNDNYKAAPDASAPRCFDIDMDDLELTLAELDKIAA